MRGWWVEGGDGKMELVVGEAKSAGALVVVVLVLVPELLLEASLTHALPRPLDATLTQLFAKNDPPPPRATTTRRHQPYRGCPPPPAKPLFSPYQPTCPLALPALLGLAHVLFARAFDSVPDWVWQITLL